MQDYDDVDVLSVGTLVSGPKLGLLCADPAGTLRSFAYVQQHAKTWRGKRLLPLCAPSLPSFSLSLVADLACSVC